jgi:hypothetical protein
MNLPQTNGRDDMVIRLISLVCYAVALALIGYCIVCGLQEHFETRTIQLNPDRGWSTPHERAEAYRRAV